MVERPPFLTCNRSEWPENKVVPNEEAQSEIRKKYKQTEAPDTAVDSTMLTTDSVPDENRLDPTRYSSWVRLTRIYARVIRFVENCRSPPERRVLGAISPEEINSAEQYFIRLAQKEEFKEELHALKSGKNLSGKSKLLPLKPMLDDDGIIRCEGRLQFTESLPWESRHPIILPRKHWITRLIIKDCHERCHHGGTNQVLSNLSSRFWIMSGRETIRDWERQCMVCKRHKASPGTQIMAPLPELRTRMSFRAFTQASVDFGGPFITKQGRGKCRAKRYLCLFTCLATRAVHLEMAYSLDTDSFLNAFYRMTSRRGLPQDMLSDNGTNFVGGNNELKELVASLDKDQIQDKTANQGVKWHFNPPPPAGPHFSGVHEVMIKAAKRAIYTILSSADINDEELLSAIVGAEGLINSRPLTYQSANPSDIVPLTPNHFLHGQMGGEFAPETVDTTAFNPRKRWRRVQELVRHFWHRWLREWLPGLNSRKKWMNIENVYKVGDIVLVLSPDSQRGKWPLGKIVKVYPGNDGNVRVVDVQVGDSIIKRPNVKLCPLEDCET